MLEYVLYTVLQSELSHLFYGFLIIAFGGYGLLTGGAFLYVHVLRRNAWLKRKIQEAVPTNADIRREIFWSLSSTFVWVFFAIGIIIGVDQGVFKLYFSIDERGVLYFIFSIAILILTHDAYFYWSHRLMHWNYTFYQIVHGTHHKSTNPTPFAIHAFNPLEAIIYALYIPLILLILPVHVYALLIWFSIETLVNLMGHLGHEAFPLAWRRSRMSQWLGTATHHNLHHQTWQYGFGHYFNIWDRIMGTNPRDYDDLITRD